MKRFITLSVLMLAPIIAQCDWNSDGSVDILDIIPAVDCILTNCFDGSQCDWNGDGQLDILDIVETVSCILSDGGCEYETNSCIDYDGNEYEIVQIGNQIWMAENLRATHYQNGDDIPTGFSDSDWGILDGLGAFSVYPWENDYVSQSTCNGNCTEVYGNLYNWSAVNDERGICPEGYHVPSDEEWIVLTNYIVNDGFAGFEGAVLKEEGYNHWIFHNDYVNGFDNYGFTALPGGSRSFSNGEYSGMGYNGLFWSSTSMGNTFARVRELSSSNSDIDQDSFYKQYGISVRCVADE